MKIAFVKFAGCAAGGVEKYLQTIAMMVKDVGHDVDYYYTNAAPITTTTWVHPDNDSVRIKLLEDSGINVIKVNVESRHHNTWINSDFFEKFKEDDYDCLITAGNGEPEYPYTEINNIPIIHTIHGHHAFNKSNISSSVLLCNWQAEMWLNGGGDSTKLNIIPPFVSVPKEYSTGLRKEYNIPDDAFVFGMHQRNDPSIFSNFSLECFRQLNNENTYMFIMGDSNRHRDYVNAHNIERVVFADFCSTVDGIHNFLDSLDVYAHSRADGEVCSASIIEAMYHGLPVVTCPGINNGHKEQVDGCGFFCYNMEDYKKAMSDLNIDNKLYQNMSKKTLQKYNDKYSFETTRSKFVSLLENEVLK